MIEAILLSSSLGATGSGVSKERAVLGSFVTIGSGKNGQVKIEETDPATSGGGYSVQVKVNTGENKPLAAALNTKDLAISLGTDAKGELAPAKNTAALIATAINELESTPFTATASGTGADPITELLAKTNIDPVYADITEEVVVGFRPRYVRLVAPAASKAGIVTEWQEDMDSGKGALCKEDTGFSCAELAADGLTITERGFIMGYACQVSQGAYHWIALG